MGMGGADKDSGGRDVCVGAPDADGADGVSRRNDSNGGSGPEGSLERIDNWGCMGGSESTK